MSAIALAVALSFPTVASATGAQTAPPPAASARWYVETAGPSCEAQRAALEHEIRLACEAVGGSCSLATAPSDAGLRAVLDCSGADGSWSLVTRTVGGTVLGSLDLSGTDEDRLREAAVEVARDATPERSLAIETLRFSLSAEQAVAPPRSSSHTLALALGGTMSSGIDPNLPATFGARVLAGLEVARSTHLTLGFGAEAGGSGLGAARGYRGGAGIAFGAPLDPKAPVGFALEGGLSAVSHYTEPDTAIDDLALARPSTAVGCYGQGMFVVQWPNDILRPFAALTASALSAPVHVAAGAELGLAFTLY